MGLDRGTQQLAQRGDSCGRDRLCSDGSGSIPSCVEAGGFRRDGEGGGGGTSALVDGMRPLVGDTFYEMYDVTLPASFPFQPPPTPGSETDASPGFSEHVSGRTKKT